VSDKSTIEWTESTWNPVTGCTKVSPGCDHCYAERITERFHGPGSFAEVRLHPDRLRLPTSWRRPRMVFVNSMSDLFHTDVPDGFISAVFEVMAATPRHTFQVLTKRHARLRSWTQAHHPEPLPNVWLGVSVENNHWARVRIPALTETPAAVRFLSCEPLLGPVHITPYAHALHWVITGGESGPGARRCDAGWVRDIRDQCNEKGVAFFHKQWGGARPKTGGRELDGRTWDEMPQTGESAHG
jgi:protein gp37